MDLLKDLSEIALKAQDALSAEDFLLDFQSFTNFYYPAFSIILARSAIATYQGNIENIYCFINQLKCNSVRIGLKLDGDPMENVLSAISDQDKLKEREKEKNRLLLDQIETEKEVTMPSIEEAEEAKIESRTFIMPEYEKAFDDGLRKLDSGIATKAVSAATAFAMRHPKILSKTDDIQALPDHYRIKFDDSYRIIILWKPGSYITIFDVIHRKDLEKWIRNKREV